MGDSIKHRKPPPQTGWLTRKSGKLVANQFFLGFFEIAQLVGFKLAASHGFEP
jgi:hypothetical protein